MSDTPRDMTASPTERGFLTYAGGPIDTQHGHRVTVRESSAATEPCVWVFIEPPALSARLPEVEVCSTETPGILLAAVREPASAGCNHDLHLALGQALVLRAALDQFIEGVPEWWEGGEGLLDKARKEVFGGE